MAAVKRSVRQSNPAQRDAPGKPALGSHLSVAGGVWKALMEAERLGCDSVQIFVKNQRRWQSPPISDLDVAAFRRLLAQRPIPTVTHASYLINLAAADEALYRKSAEAFADELLRCDQLGVRYLVVHPGAAGEQPRAAALKRIAAALDGILREHACVSTMPLLETTAGQGTTLGRSFEELAGVLSEMEHGKRVGVCADTCHLFAAGYDFREKAQYEAMLNEADRLLGAGRIRCWHLNDSVGGCGSRRDRHEHIGQGQIGRSGFANVVRDPRWSGVPMILETEKGTDERGRKWDSVNLAVLRRLMQRGVRQ
ncbi:MAG: deoxyribonuclease IV [Planctomycetes bacterium]|nr:deoxyribonuclease IV [Planctomycetota bacterium]